MCRALASAILLSKDCSLDRGEVQQIGQLAPRLRTSTGGSIREVKVADIGVCVAMGRGRGAKKYGDVSLA